MGNLQTAYLIVGDDALLASRELDKVLGEVESHAINEFSAADEIGAVIQSLRTPSMFDDHRVLLCRSAEELSSDALRELVAYLEDPIETSSLVLVSTKPLAKVAAAVKKHGRVIEAGKGRRNDVMSWLREEAKAAGLKMGADTLTALVESVGDERMALAQAIEELSLSGRGKTISAENVRTHFQGRSDTKVFAFIDAVAARQAGPALETLHRVLRQGEAPALVFWSLLRHFRMLLIASEASAASAARELGIPDWRAEKLVRQARAFGVNSLIDAYQLLAAADHKMKKSEEPEELTLERTVVAISGS